MRRSKLTDRAAKQRVHFDPRYCKDTADTWIAVSQLRLQEYICSTRKFKPCSFFAQTRAEAIQLAAMQFCCNIRAVHVQPRKVKPKMPIVPPPILDPKFPWGTPEQQRIDALKRIEVRKAKRTFEPNPGAPMPVIPPLPKDVNFDFNSED